MIQQVKTKLKKFIVLLFNIINHQILKIWGIKRFVLLLDKINILFYNIFVNKLKEYLEFLID